MSVVFPRALAFETGLAWAGRPGACGKILLFLLSTFALRQKAQGVHLGSCYSDLAGRPGNHNKAPTHPIKVENVNNGTH